MYKRYLKVISFAMVLLMAASMLGACRKGEDNQQATASETKTSTAAMMTSMATSKATGNTTTEAKSTVADGSATKGTSGSETASSEGVGGEKTGPGSETETGTEGKVENETEADDNGNSSDGNLSEEIPDLKGRVIKFVVHLATLVPSLEPGQVGGEKLYYLMKEAEEKFNCTFEFSVLAHANLVSEFTNSAMAGVYFADVIRCNGTSTIPFEKNNFIMPINDYIDLNIPYIKQYDHLHWHGVINPQNVYGLFRSVFQGPSGIWYDNEVLGREGIPDLKEYYYNGNWNWDTFLEVALKTTKDVNGDGIVDQWGTGSTSFSDFCIKMMWSNGGKSISYDEAQKRYYYSLNDPAAINTLQFVSDLYHVYQVVPNKNCFNDFLAGNVGMFLYEDWRGLAYYTTYGRPDLGFVTMPQGPDNLTNDFTLTAGGHFFFYPTNISNPKDVIQATSYWIACWDETKDYYFTIEEMIDTEAKRYFCTEENYEFYLEYMKKYKQIKDFTATFSPAQSRINTGVFAEMAKERRSPVPMIQAMENEISSIIADAMGY
jgi:multiple sugar transport system substrate-binding protein